MNDKTRAAIQQALEYLRDNQHYIADNERHAYVMEYNAFVERLEALADHVPDATKMIEQPAQQEPVANIRTWHKNGDQHAELWNWDRGIESLPDGEHDLYTRPQAPATPLHGEPLTDEEIDDIWNYYCDEMGDASINDSYEIARAIEAKLKEKNT